MIWPMSSGRVLMASLVDTEYAHCLLRLAVVRYGKKDGARLVEILCDHAHLFCDLLRRYVREVDLGEVDLDAAPAERHHDGIAAGLQPACTLRRPSAAALTAAFAQARDSDGRLPALEDRLRAADRGELRAERLLVVVAEARRAEDEPAHVDRIKAGARLGLGLARLDLRGDVLGVGARADRIDAELAHPEVVAQVLPANFDVLAATGDDPVGLGLLGLELLGGFLHEPLVERPAGEHVEIVAEAAVGQVDLVLEAGPEPLHVEPVAQAHDPFLVGTSVPVAL